MISLLPQPNQKRKSKIFVYLKKLRNIIFAASLFVFSYICFLL